MKKIEKFYKHWKKPVYLCLAVILICLGMKSTCFAAGDTALQSSKVSHVVCAPKSIIVSGHLFVQRQMKPTGVEICRAKINADGTRGSFKKVGICTKFTQGKQHEDKWKFTYEDSTVKTGQAYVYKFRGYRKDGEVTGFQQFQFKKRKAVAAREAGEYTCRVVENTSASLVLKLKGIRKNNGPLECYVDDAHSYSVFLVCKNKGKNETLKSITPEAYSYDGEEWYSEQSYTVKGKQGVYLRFNGEDINVSGYQYVQMMMGYMRYNLCPWGTKDTAMPQMRLNLTSGKASVGNYIIWDSEQWEWVTKWDKNQLQYKIPVTKDTDVIYSYLERINCSPDSITVCGEVRNHSKGQLDTTGADIFPAGVEIYRAEVENDGESGTFQRIGVCKDFEYDGSRSSYDEWRFVYTDSEVTAGQSYEYQVRPFMETENSRKFQKKQCVSYARRGIAANAVGEYTCEVVENTSDTLIIKITGKDKNNGPLACCIFDEIRDTHIVYKNEGETQISKLISIEAYSYDGKKWLRGNDSIKGTEALYLSFNRPYKESFEDYSNYQYVQIMVIRMNYNTSVCQLRLNLATGEAVAGDFTIGDNNEGEEGEWLVWDGDVFAPKLAA